MLKLRLKIVRWIMGKTHCLIFANDLKEGCCVLNSNTPDVIIRTASDIVEKVDIVKDITLSTALTYLARHEDERKNFIHMLYDYCEDKKEQREKSKEVLN